MHFSSSGLMFSSNTDETDFGNVFSARESFAGDVFHAIMYLDPLTVTRLCCCHHARSYMETLKSLVHNLCSRITCDSRVLELFDNAQMRFAGNLYAT